ncbi:hypothetical protein HanOQP8_Chr12g0435221 [Helianthus annuus]|nr:hypothetical protein HanOQP8_Chr12g0435221 [Helianthus annuus]
MNIQIHPTANFTLSSRNPRIFFLPQFPPNPQKIPKHTYTPKPLFKTLIKCSQTSDSDPPKWEKLLPKNIISADKILRSIAGATSSPICQFISSPTTFLHSVDPRIKLIEMGLGKDWIFIVGLYGVC